MNYNQAQKLAQYHKFTRRELFSILEKALDSHSDKYWEQPDTRNPLFSRGFYFNWVRDLIKYKKGINDETHPNELICIRVLERFGKHSNIQLPKKEKFVAEKLTHQKPVLNAS